MSNSERRYRRRVLRPLLAFAALAALAVVFAPTGSAKPPTASIKLYDVCLQGGTTACTDWSTSGGSTSTISGTNPQVTLNVKNESGSNTTLGSLNLNMPSGVTLQTVADPLASTSTSTQLQLRNLNLAPGASHPVTFSITAPNVCETLQWSVAAKQSNDFNGSGNDYQLKQSGGLTSLITTGCHLAWLHQPASAVQSIPITDTAFDSTGHSVDVAIEDASNNTVDLTTGTGTVTLSPVTGSFDDCGACNPGFSGVMSAFQHGVATFSNFKSDYTGTGFTMQASALGLTTSASSPPFVIQTNGMDCVGQNPCVLNTTINNSPLTISGNGGQFLYIAVSSSALPSSVTGPLGGCANFVGTGSAFAETDGRNGDGSVDLTINIPNSALKKEYGPNYGQPNVPICAGAKRLDANNQPLDCTQDTLGVPGGGFADRNLGPGGTFNGTYGHAICGAGGYWWGVLGTFQDPTSLGFDSSLIPLITGWGTNATNSGLRTFTVHEPGASVNAPSAWDGHFGY